MSDRTFPEDTRYLERAEPGNGWRHRLERKLLAWPARLYQLLLRKRLDRLLATTAAAPPLDALRERLRREGLTDAALVAYVAALKSQGWNETDLRGALAVALGTAVQCREPSSRVDMLAAAAGLVALSGRQVHLLTADDASAEHLHAGVADRLAWLEATRILQATPLAERRRAYGAPVLVIPAREALRDYLEDRLSLRLSRGEVGRKLARLAGNNPLSAARMRGLPFGIVVDANRVLVDQACTPLVLAGRLDPGGEQRWAEIALHLASALKPEQHFLYRDDGSVELTGAGEFELSHRANALPGAWRNRNRRHADVCLALGALALKAGDDYRVADGRVELPPEQAGREGLQQLLEQRAGLPVTGRSRVRGKLTYQRFFRRYHGLAALCGDLRHHRGELWDIYGLPAIELTPPAEVEAPPVVLTPGQQRAVVAAGRVGLGGVLEQFYVQRRRAQERRDAEHLRRGLLHLDNQVGTVTAFMGRSE